MILLIYCLVAMIIMACYEGPGTGPLLYKSIMILLAPIILPVAFIGGIFCLCFTRWS